MYNIITLVIMLSHLCRGEMKMRSPCGLAYMILLRGVWCGVVGVMGWGTTEPGGSAAGTHPEVLLV